MKRIGFNQEETLLGMFIKLMLMFLISSILITIFSVWRFFWIIPTISFVWGGLCGIFYLKDNSQ